MSFLYTYKDGVSSSESIHLGPSRPAAEDIKPPYLSLKEESTYYRITCDGYVLRFYKTSSDYFVRFLDVADTTEITLLDGRVTVSSTDYAFMQDTNRVCSLIENTVTRIVIRYVGNFDSTYGSSSNYLTGSTACIYTFYIYHDRFSVNIEWIIGTQITLDSDRKNNLLRNHTYFASSNGQCFYESAGSELIGEYQDDVDCDSYNYVGGVSDIINTQYIVLSYELVGSGTAAAEQETLETAGVRLGFNNGTMPVGTHKMFIMVLFDTPEREDITPNIGWSDRAFTVGDLVLHNDIGYECISVTTSGSASTTEPGVGSSWTTYWVQCHKYTSTDRLAMGTQYYDIDSNTNLPDIVDSTGSLVTDMVIPKTIDSSEAFASDGAHHLDLDLDSNNDNAIIEFNQDEEKPAIVLHDPSIRTGDGTTEHCVAHLKLEQLYNTSYLKDEITGDDDSIFSVNGYSGVSFVDAIRGKGYQNLYDDTASSIQFTSADIMSTAEGTIMFDLIVANDTIASNKWIFYSGNGLKVYRDSNDRFYFAMTGSTAVVYINQTNNAGDILHVTLSWYNDGSYGFLYLKINEEVDIKYHTDSVVDFSTTCYMAAYNASGSYECDGIMDNVKFYDACILPYGSFVSAQHIDDDDFTDAHSDITFYWDGSDCTSTDVAIGGVQGTLDTNNTGGTTSFVTTGGPAGTGYFDNESMLANLYNIEFPVTSNDIITPTFCSIGFWMYMPTWGSYNRILTLGNSTTYAMELLTEGINDTGELNFRLNNTVPTSFAEDSVVDSEDIPVAQWNYIRINIDTAKGGGQVYANGQEIIDLTTFTGTLQTIDRIVIGADRAGTNTNDQYIYGLTITNNPNTPEIPFVLGHGPVCVPTVENSKKVS